MNEVEELTNRLASLEGAVGKISDWIDEKSHIGADVNIHGNGHNFFEHGVNGPNSGEENLAVNAGSPSAAIGSSVKQGFNLQKEFANIKDALTKVKLESTDRLNESPLGIKKQDKPAFNILQKNARYLETILKIAQVASLDPKVNAAQGEAEGTTDFVKYMQQITIVLRAGLEYNQQEYQALLVGSQFDQDTTRFFRIMQRSENCFTPHALTQLKLAAEITNASRTTSTTGTRPSFFNQNRGRGGFRGQQRQFNRQYNRPFNQFNYGRPPPRPEQGDE